jgi:hypothetical protein
MSRLLAPVLAAALASGACLQSDEPALTGVELFITNDPALGLDSLELKGKVDGDQAFPTTVLPDPPRPLAAAGESVIILVREELAGARLELDIKGLAGGEKATETKIDLELIAGEVIAVPVGLGVECGETECNCGDGGCAGD